MSKSDNLSPVLLLWLPLAALVIQLVLEFTLPAHTLSILLTEGGPHENLEFLVLLIALGVSVATLFRIDWKKQKWIGLWVLIAAACCFYVAGEEVSWGQHIVHWHTPEFWSKVNDQNETNLHNTSSWLDQKPRLVLQLGILFGGIIFPIVRRFRPNALPKKFAIIYPSSNLFLVAFIAFGVNMIDRVKIFHIFERASEVEELYVFYFIMLYLLILRRRILQGQS